METYYDNVGTLQGHCPWRAMAAPRKAVESEQFSITLNKQTIEMLERLVEIGLHGNTRGEVARTLISSQLEELVVRGVLSLKG